MMVSWATRARTRLPRAAAVAALVLCGCASEKAAPVPGMSTPQEDGPVSFRYDSLDARPVASDAARGRPAVLAFITTGDIVSQAQVSFLVPMSRHDGDSVYYALIALQDPSTRELVEAYRDAMKVKFPVGMADEATIAGGGPLGDVHSVPTVVILDRGGHVVFRRTGLCKSDELRAHLHGL